MLIAWIGIVMLLGLGFALRFIQDDAFISFRYAYNLIHGHGLTWNAGSDVPVEGYTNFLWVLLVALGMFLGLDPEPWSVFLGLTCATFTLYFTYRLSLAVSSDRRSPLIAIALLGTNYSYSCYITGGLETQLQTCLIAAIACSVVEFFAQPRRASIGFFVSLSFLCALAELTRLDSVLLWGLLASAAVILSLRHCTGRSQYVVDLAAVILPFGVVVGAWFVWKYSYYGELVPNTFYIKAAGLSGETVMNGWLYCKAFAVAYGHWVFLVIGVVLAKKLAPDFRHYLLLGTVIVWLAYVVKIGGDFMEFRMMIPVLPLVFVLSAEVLRKCVRPAMGVVVVVAIALSSADYATTYPGGRMIESVTQLDGHVGFGSMSWRYVGIELGELFSDSTEPVTIATGAAGAIPYFSRLRAIDTLGLNDRWIARHGYELGGKPGHTKHATMDYLMARGVNLVMEQPYIGPLDAPPVRDASFFFQPPIEEGRVPAEAKVIEIPLRSGMKVFALYLKRHPYIDDVIVNRGLKVVELDRQDAAPGITEARMQ